MSDSLKRFDQMTETEQRDFRRQHLERKPLGLPHGEKRFDDMSPQEQREFQAAIGTLPPLSLRREAERDR